MSHDASNHGGVFGICARFRLYLHIAILIFHIRYNYNTYTHRALTYFEIIFDITMEPVQIHHFPHKYQRFYIASWDIFFRTLSYMAELMLSVTLHG